MAVLVRERVPGKKSAVITFTISFLGWWSGLFLLVWYLLVGFGDDAKRLDR
jgi:hypothetical protein